MAAVGTMRNTYMPLRFASLCSTEQETRYGRCVRQEVASLTDGKEWERGAGGLELELELHVCTHARSLHAETLSGLVCHGYAMPCRVFLSTLPLRLGG